jgi:hypothetical protein
MQAWAAPPAIGPPFTLPLTGLGHLANTSALRLYLQRRRQICALRRRQTQTLDMPDWSPRVRLAEGRTIHSFDKLLGVSKNARSIAFSGGVSEVSPRMAGVG